MNCEVEKRGNVLIVAPEGELDVSNVPELQNLLDSHIQKGEIQIIIDLQKVTYMDSSALGVLVNTLKQVRRKNGNLKVSNLVGNVDRIFRLTRLIHFFDTYPSRQAALESFKKIH